MSYQLLIFDLDGTAIPNQPDGLPSEKVLQAVRAAQKKTAVSAASGRSLSLAQPVLDKLQLTEPCILSGGTQVYDSVKKVFLWEKALSREQAQAVYQVCHPYPYEVWINDELSGAPAAERTLMGTERIMYILSVSPADTKKIVPLLKRIPNIAVHQVHSWKPGDFDLHITHAEATKKQALSFLQEYLHVSPQGTIAIGDSGNDLPLFELAGLKVAMGNAAEALKAQADFIAPSVSDDGVAVTIQTYVI